jgi:HAD superfamily phosphatase (TIGR01668 family)
MGSVAELTPDLIERHMPEVEGVTFDLDNTLLGQNEYAFSAENVDALITLNAIGYRLGFLSNAQSRGRTNRVHIMAASLSGVIEEITVVTPSMVEGKKKPFRPIFDKMSEEIGIESEKLCHVGDQLLKDVLGANRAGYGGSVLVAPYGRGDDLLVGLLQRPLEAALRPFLGLPFLTRDFSGHYQRSQN